MNEVTQLINEPIFTKKALAEFLGISVRTVFRYHEIAFLEIDDFSDDYPKDKRGIWVTNGRLTSYQCWVLIQIMNLGNKYQKKLLPKIIASRKEQYSKHSFLADMVNKPKSTDCKISSLFIKGSH